MGIFDRFKKSEPEPDLESSPETPSGPANPQGPDGPDAPQPPGGPQRTDAPTPTDVKDSNPSGGGPDGLEGDLGISSERTGPASETGSATEGIEGTGTVGSSVVSTDGTTTDTATDIEGPEMDETQNPAEVPSHESDPKSNPGTSSQGTT